MSILPRAKKTEKKEESVNEEEEVKTEEKSLTITDLPGIGPSTAAKLIDSGYSTLESIATVSIGELSAIGSLGEKTAVKIIESAQKALDISFLTAKEYLKQRKALKRITTGSKTLDELFGGGIETGSITEFFGEYRTGKTQLAHQLCVTSQLPRELGGMREGDDVPKVFYVDTEGTFRPERISDMIERYSETLNEEDVLDNIEWGRAFNSDHQMVLCEKIVKEHIGQEKIALLVVDSLTAHFRAEYVGRGTLASRQQKLNQHIHVLLRAAEIGNLSVIVTNQVQSQPDQFFGDPNKAVGGHIVAHATQTRVYLRKSKGERRIARVVDSPLLPENEAVFGLTKEGIVDI